MSSEASYLAPHGPKPQENFLIKTTAPSCKGISFPGPKGNYPESGRGDFFFFPRAPEAQKPGQVGAYAQNEQNGMGGDGLLHWLGGRALGPWLRDLVFWAGRWPAQARVWLWLLR